MARKKTLRLCMVLIEGGQLHDGTRGPREETRQKNAAGGQERTRQRDIKNTDCHLAFMFQFLMATEGDDDRCFRLKEGRRDQKGVKGSASTDGNSNITTSKPISKTKDEKPRIWPRLVPRGRLERLRQPAGRMGTRPKGFSMTRQSPRDRLKDA